MLPEFSDRASSIRPDGRRELCWLARRKGTGLVVCKQTRVYSTAKAVVFKENRKRRPSLLSSLWTYIKSATAGFASSFLARKKDTVRCPFWCEKRDLNPYSVNYTPLKRARLPVPPLSHIDLFFVCSSSPSNVRSLQLRPVPPLSHIQF